MTYSTNHLGIAAAIISLGERLLDVSWSGHKATFVLSDTSGYAAQYAQEYMKNNLNVPAFAFHAAERQLKSILYSKENEIINE